MKFKPLGKFFICNKCEINSLKFPDRFEKEDIDMYSLMGLDMGLVSPRHLFRMPYSLHEKSALASVVLSEEDLDKFIEDPNYKEKVADPLRVSIKKFMPESEENEAAELVMQAFDWAREAGFDKEVDKNSSGKFANFKIVKLHNLEAKQFPPCIKKILEGADDGKKRALFALINFFRSLGMEKEEMETIIYEWNDKNKEPLKKSYIHSQLTWTYRRKPLMPPSCRDFYVDLGVCNPQKLCEKIKNPISYTMRKNFAQNQNAAANTNREDKKSNYKSKVPKSISR